VAISQAGSQGRHHGAGPCAASGYRAEAAIDAAVAGIGATRLLSHQAAEAVARGALQIILAQYEREPIPVSILHAGPGMPPLKMRTFRDFAAPVYRSPPVSRDNNQNYTIGR
jgi:DNA-binding transcriptional LysR family regulator